MRKRLFEIIKKGVQLSLINPPANLIECILNELLENGVILPEKDERGFYFEPMIKGKKEKIYLLPK